MNKTSIINILVLTAILLSLFACGGGGGGGGTPTPITSNKWTILVYMDGDNDLDLYTSGDLAEMMKVGSSSSATVIVQYDGYQKPAKRMKVERGSLTTLQELGEVNMTSADTIADFVRYGVTTYPADRYMLLMWDHGNGWKSGGVSLPKTTSSLLSDWDSNGYRSSESPNGTVAKGIRDGLSGTGRKLDILGVDACIMATLEAAYEFRDLADFMVASQELVSVQGWDYKALLETLTSTPDITGEALAKEIVRQYGVYMSGYGLTNQTLSALRLSSVKAVADAAGQLASARLAALKDPAQSVASAASMTSARTGRQEFDQYGDYVDLADFSQALEGAASPVAAAVRSMVVANYNGPASQMANGLSVAFFNIPKLYEGSTFLKISLFDPAYTVASKRSAAISFLDSYSWDEMLDTYYRAAYPEQYQKLLDGKFP